MQQEEIDTLVSGIISHGADNAYTVMHAKAFWMIDPTFGKFNILRLIYLYQLVLTSTKLLI